MKILNKKVCLFGLSFLVILLLSNVNAFALTPTDTPTNALQIVMCNALALITGGVGRTIAAFAVISLGAGFFMGKINWSTMLAMALGIAALFGAPTIVNAIAGGDEDPCANITTEI
jgi:type IV secretory pathway VirB2 component (pilin)